MVEIDLNRILVSSIKRSGGWAHKIRDPGFMEIKKGVGKNPYDIFGTTSTGRGIHLEAKLIKPDTQVLLSSFPFSKIEDHQIENLTTLCNIRKRNGTDQILAYPIGYWRSRTLFIVFFFDADYIHSLIKGGKLSLKGKEMMELYDQGRYLSIHKKQLDAKKIASVIIKS